MVSRKGSLPGTYNEEEYNLLKQFKFRCVRCQREFDTIHECTPRSQGKESMQISNRVPICVECHTWAHSAGTKVSAPILLDMREKRLEQYGNN